MIFNSFSELPETLKEIIKNEVISRIDDFQAMGLHRDMVDRLKSGDNIMNNYKFDFMRDHFCNEPLRNGDYITKIMAGEDTLFIQIVNSKYDDILSNVIRDIRIQKINSII